MRRRRSLPLAIACLGAAVSAPRDARADIVIETAGPNALTVDIRQERVAGFAAASLATTASIPAPQPDRWYYGWLGFDAAGAPTFELRLDDAGPPKTAPDSRIVTAVRTDKAGAIDPFRQIDERVWFDRDYALLRVSSTDGAWTTRGLVPDDPATDGSAPMVPVDLAPIWFARAEPVRSDAAGPGLAEIDLGAAEGGYVAIVKGLAGVEANGAVHGQDELPVHHHLGAGTYAVRTHAEGRASLYATGFRLMGADRLLVESTAPSTVHVRAELPVGDVIASVDVDATLPSAEPDRWYLGWLYVDETGAPGVELRLDDAGPPDQPAARLVTAARTGPDGTILPAYRQIGPRVTFDLDVEVMHEEIGTVQWVERDLVPFEPAAMGSAPLVPIDHAVQWYSRGEMMRAPGLGAGIGQITMGMLATTDAGAFATQIKGYAYALGDGPGHGQDEVPVHHRLGRGTFGFYLNSTVAANLFATGFRLGTQGHTRIETDDDDSTLLHVDLDDVHLGDGRYVTLHDVASVTDLDPGAWYYGWVTRDDAGAVALTLRPADAGPPPAPLARIVTALYVDLGGHIAPRYRQLDDRVSFDGDLTLADYVDGSGWVETSLEAIDDDYVGRTIVPVDLATLWYTRTEVVNKPRFGVGLAEIALGMRPADAGSFSTGIRGFADTQPPGAVFVNDEVPVHHERGHGTFSFRVSDRTRTSILIVGYSISGAWPSDLDPPPPGGSGTGGSGGDGDGSDGSGPGDGGGADTGDGHEPGVDEDRTDGCGCVAGDPPSLAALLLLVAIRRRRRLKPRAAAWPERSPRSGTAPRPGPPRG